MAIQADIQQQVFDLLSRNSNVTIVPAEQPESSTSTTQQLSLAPGQRVSAEVMGQAQAGRIPVQIAGQQLNLELQMQVRQGQTLELTFISSDPRPTFAMTRPGVMAPPVSLSDASRLLSLIVSNEQFNLPGQRSSLQSIGDLIRSNSGSNTVSNMLEEFLSYPTAGRGVVVAPAAIPTQPQMHVGGDPNRPMAPSAGLITPPLPQAAQQTATQQTTVPTTAQAQTQTQQQATVVQVAEQSVRPQPATEQTPQVATSSTQQVTSTTGTQPQLQTAISLPAGQTAVTAQFEDLAAKLLMNLAPRERITLLEVTTSPKNPLPLKAGDETTALVQSSQPDGRTMVKIGTEQLELQLPKQAAQGETLRMTMITQQPRLIFAMQGPSAQAVQPDAVSDAARWFTALVDRDTGQASQHQAVISRLQQVVSSLPPGSPALASIMDEAMTYNAAALMPSRATNSTAQPLPDVKTDDAIMKLLQALLHSNRMALLEPKVDPNAFRGMQPGQQMRGEVLQDLGGQRFMVQISGQSFEVMLPKGVQAGDRLNLFFVNEHPPTFLLIRHTKGGDAMVSQTSRWLNNMLASQDTAPAPKEGLGILRTMLQGMPNDPQQLEQGLKQGIRNSGMFYESHLSRWFSGKMPLEQLLQEPQGRLSNLQNAAAQRQGQIALQDGVDPRTMPLVKEQLATLQTGQMLFQGELIPGQPMEWRIKDREAGGQQDDHEQEQEQPWETTMVITLPKLGRVEIDLDLANPRVDLVLAADQPGTTSLMEQEMTGLKEQLLAAGLEPGRLTVSNNG